MFKKQTVFAVRAALVDIAELRPIVSLAKQSSDYIAARFKYEVHPVPKGYDATDVCTMFANSNWKCRPLLTKPGFPDTWIIACDTPPTQEIFSFTQGDVVLTLINRNNTKFNPVPERRTYSFNTSDQASTASERINSNVHKPPVIATQLESKLDTFIKNQEAFNAGIQQSVTQVKQSIQVVSDRSTKLESAFDEVRSLRAFLDSRLGGIEKSLSTEKGNGTATPKNSSERTDRSRSPNKTR